MKTGKLVGQLHMATEKKAVVAALIKIKKLIDPKRPDVGCASQVARFLRAGDAICSLIIERFQLIIEADPVESVRQYVRAGVPSEAQRDLTAAAVGVARYPIDKLIRDQQIPVLSATNFRRQFQAFVRRSDLTNLLTSKVPQPAEGAIHHVVSLAPTFAASSMQLTLRAFQPPIMRVSAERRGLPRTLPALGRQ